MTKLDRRQFLRGVGAAVVGGTATLTAETVLAQRMPTPIPLNSETFPAVAWRMTTSWPETLDVMLGGPRVLAERVAAMTNNQFRITVFTAGEVAQALEVLNAVKDGVVESGHTASFYFVDNNESFAISTGLPFGLTPQQQNAWLYYGGGMEAIQKVYADFNIVSFPCGGTGTQMGGWMREEIVSLADLQHLRFRIPGLGGRVMQQLGVETVVIPSNEIHQALESGDIDAAEWIGPYDDQKLGLNHVADYYYYPGWWEPGSTLDVLVNRQAWDALPPIYQHIFKTATYQAHISMLSQYEVKNQQALVELVASGTQLRPYSEEILSAAKEAAFTLYEETAKTNPSFKEIYEPWKEFRRQIFNWNRFNELSFSTFATENL
jgi:TRAP-type mannitol/chloroaromatic compound transport system substrate-binding protein